MITGHCECNKISFQVTGDISDFSHCHCSQCRRLHGAAFATFAGVKAKDFAYLKGKQELATYASSDSHQRVFCKNCGSNILVSLTDEPEALYLSMSTIVGNPPCPAGYHIYVGSKAPWYTIEDQLPQYDTIPEDQ
jgi:hypothetical protein